MEALKALQIIGNQNDVNCKGCVFISSKYRVTKGFKFHARPQTGAYSCFTLKGISPQVSRLHVKERTMTDVFTHSHPITSLSAFINTLMFTDKEVSQFFIRKNSA